MSKRSPSDPCPRCNEPAWQKCWECGWSIHDEPSDEAEPAIRRVGRIPDERDEKTIEAAIMADLEKLGWVVYKTSQRQKPIGMSVGIADLYVVGYGVTAWLEVKTAKGRQSDAQKIFQMDVEKHGGIYEVVRSEAEAVDWARQYMPQQAA